MFFVMLSAAGRPIKMRDENEIKLKRAYWFGVYDALNTAEKGRSEKLDKEKLTAQVWIAALDWLLGQSEESAKLDRPEEIKK
jgi:hypothetical protein